MEKLKTRAEIIQKINDLYSEYENQENKDPNNILYLIDQIEQLELDLYLLETYKLDKLPEPSNKVIMPDFSLK